MQINHIGFIIFYLCVFLIIITNLIDPTVNMCLTPRIELRSEINAANLKVDNTDLVDNCDYIDWDHIDNLNKETTNKLTVVQLNIRGIKGKYYDIIDLINKLNSPDVIILCETWLKTNDIQPQISGYDYIGKSRQNRKGGGVGFLINKKLKSRNVPELQLEDEIVKSLFIEIKGNHHNMLIGAIYRPPNTPVGSFLNHYSDMCSKLHKHKHVIIGLNHNLDLLKSTRHSQMQQFLEITLEANLILTITKPTRVTNTSATLIDNILIKSDLHETHRSNVIIDNISDHYPSILAIDNPHLSIVESQQVTVHKINENEIVKIKNKLYQTNWNAELNALDANKAFNKLHNKPIKILDSVAPEKITNIRTRRNVPWFTLGIKKSNIKDKRLSKASHCKTTTEAQKERYKEYHKVLLKTKRTARQLYYRKLCKEFRYNSQKLWKIINSITGKTNNKYDIVDYLKVNNVEIHKRDEIATEFAKHFSNVGAYFGNKILTPKRTSTDYLSNIPSSNASLFLAPTTPTENLNLMLNYQIKRVLDMTK